MSATPKTGTRYAYTAAELEALRNLVWSTGRRGLSRPEALASMPMHRSRMKFLLRELCDLGKAGSHGWTRWTRYYSPEMARHVAEHGREKELQAAAEDPAAEDAPCSLPVHRVIVPAHLAPRLSPAGPRSVFDLARAA